MHILLIADTFPPLSSSGAVQLGDLSSALVQAGHEVSVLTAAPDAVQQTKTENLNGVTVIRVKSLPTKNVGLVRRTVGELLLPFFMFRAFIRSPLRNVRWEGIVWYSPTIFLGPLIHRLKKITGCKAYLIIRDIFPEWALDMGLLRKGVPYFFFQAIAASQYAAADIIGVQTAGNLTYFKNRRSSRHSRIEVLPNWLEERPNRGCSVVLENTALAGRRIFVYAGNMGVAQGMGIVLDVAAAFRHRRDVGFLFVGRGSETERLKRCADRQDLGNVVFHDEIDPDDIPGLYAQCHAGLVILDPRHRTHNIPGKFVSYMFAGLPVLARVNPGNDLIDLITTKQLGKVVTDSDTPKVIAAAEALLAEIAAGTDFASRCKTLAREMFSPETAARAITQSLAQ